MYQIKRFEDFTESDKARVEFACMLQGKMNLLDPEKHEHKCPAKTCGHVWDHAPIEVALAKIDSDVDGHQCPVCGTEQFWKYDRDEEAAAAKPAKKTRVKKLRSRKVAHVD